MHVWFSGRECASSFENIFIFSSSHTRITAENAALKDTAKRSHLILSWLHVQVGPTRKPPNCVVACDGSRAQGCALKHAINCHLDAHPGKEIFDNEEKLSVLERGRIDCFKKRRSGDGNRNGHINGHINGRVMSCFLGRFDSRDEAVEISEKRFDGS